MQKFNVNVAKSRLSVGFTHNDSNFSRLWDNQQVFEKNNAQLQGKPFVLLDGPPYANGEAHVGHALNKLLKDLVVKSRWFMGQSVEYRPGWDCHGLPLELAVEKKYGKLPEAELKKQCKHLALKSLAKQRRVFKDLGVLGQWNEPYLTLSEPMLRQGWRTLSTLVQKNLLEYKQFPVHYCPACASALAEAELETKELHKDSLYFTVALNEKEQVLVWTTTPWTLLMNQALAYHSDFTYEAWQNEKHCLYLQSSHQVEVKAWLEQNDYHYTHNVHGTYFSGRTATSPLSGKVVPMLHAEFVQADKTGFVHVACAHGAEDYELGQMHGLVPHTYLNDYGVFAHTESMLDGKKYTQVAPLVCEWLGKALVAFSQQMQEQSVCWRHKCGVYYNATWQAFLRLDSPEYNLKAKVQNLLQHSELSENAKERLGQMLLGRKHWCLSRQRKWGLPMNLLVNADKTLNEHAADYLSLLAQGKNNEAEALKTSLGCDVFNDVVDVWFDSGNVVNEYAYRTGGVSEHTVVDMAVEGKDQYRGWFQSLLWLCAANDGRMPYRHLLCHGFVLNEKREKFSKSSGNATSVKHYTDKHGADVLHLWTASQEHEMDAVFSEKKLEEMKKYYSRMRLCLRFLSSNLYDYDYSKHSYNLQRFEHLAEYDLHRYVLREMAQVHDVMKLAFEHFEFKNALEEMYAFCEKTLSNVYFDVLKNTLYLRSLHSEQRLMTQCALYEVMMSLFDMVKVFCPFVSEEFYQDYFNQDSVFLSHHLFERVATYRTYSVCMNWQQVFDLRKEVQLALEPLQQKKLVKSRTEVKTHVACQPHTFENLKNVQAYYRLADLFSVSQVALESSDVNNLLLEDLKNNALYAKCPRCWNYELVEGFKDELCEVCAKD